MKKLIIINGTMGIGKSTVSNLLFKRLHQSVYLDGDWCWNMNPFVVTVENEQMVINNITYLLKSFLENSNYKYVVFGVLCANPRNF
jgi:broad-specificity NMP kinase